MSKKGKPYKFYLSPEDYAKYQKAQEEDGFHDRGPHLMGLLDLRHEIKAFQLDRAKEAQLIIKRFKLSSDIMEMARKEVF